MAACADLLACEQANRIWGRTLYAAAPHDFFEAPGKCSNGCKKGEWYAPCADAFAESSSCTSRELLVFTHLPKAGGTSLAKSLRAELSKSQRGVCHLYWNGEGRAGFCRDVRRWVGQRNVRYAPPLPVAPRAAHNGSLASALPFAHCHLLVAQHMDASLVHMIRDAHPTLRVRPLLLVREPTARFFAEHAYKKHCLWRQQGLPAPPQGWAISTEARIAQLRRRPPVQRAELARFLGGDSWASCTPRRDDDGGWLADELRGGKIAVEYEWVGVLEMLPQSVRLLRHVLGWQNDFRIDHANSLCVAVPDDERPTAAQRAEVAELLADDIKLYTQLRERFEQQYHAAFGESAAAVSAANSDLARSPADARPRFSLPSSSKPSPDSALGGGAGRLDGWLNSLVG